VSDDPAESVAEQACGRESRYPSVLAEATTRDDRPEQLAVHRRGDDALLASI